MRIVNRILIIAGSLILITGIPWLGYLIYQSLERPVRDPVQAIPDQTALIIKVNKPLELLGELSRNNLIWKELLKYPGVRSIQQQLLLIDSMSRGDRRIREVLKDSPLYITLSVHSRNNFDLLFLTAIPRSLDGRVIPEFFQRHYPRSTTLMQSPYGHTQIYRIHIEHRKDPLFLSVFEGVCLFSFRDELVKKAIDQLSLNTPVSVMRGFSTVASTTGKKADASLYVNFPYFSLAIWKTVNETHQNSLVRFARYADWSGLDLFIKKDELVLNGYTTASDTAMQTLALMGEQSPGAVDMFNILPAGTKAYLIYSFKNYTIYFERWQERLQRAEFPTTGMDLFSSMNTQLDTVVMFFLDPWVGKQAGRCWIQLSPREDQVYPVTILQALLPDSARKSLLILAKLTGGKADSLVADHQVIYRVPGISEALRIWTSPLLDPVELTCFTLVRDYLCFARDPAVLKKFLTQWHQQELLKDVPAYRDLRENISDRANISFYCEARHYLEYLPEVLTPEFLPLFSPVIDSLRKFQSFALQLSSDDRLFYTHLLLHYNPKTTEEGPLAWQATLDAPLAGTPRIVKANLRPEFAVLVTDTNHTLYKIDRFGRILWKQKLYGRVLGTFHPIRLPGQDSLFYLFNTEHHLYLIRCDGELAERFPMKFPVRASNGLCLIAPDTTGFGTSRPESPRKVTLSDYQVIIAFRNNRIYNFDLHGKLAEGWQSPQVEEEVVAEVSAFAHTVFVTTKSGKVLITDVHGEKKIAPPKEFTKSPHSAFYRNLTNPKAPFLTTDRNGKVLYLQENGHISRVSFNKFSPDHYFFYTDIIGDGTPEFIFFDHHTLYFYNRFFKPIYFYTFRHTVSPPRLIQTPDGKSFIGFVSPSTSEVFLFDRHGYVEIESGIKGITPFDIGTLEDPERLNLVIGVGKVLKGFRLSRF